MGIVFTDTTDLINKALKKCGVVGVGRNASAEEIMDGLQTLNVMLDEWGVLRELINVRVSDTLAVVSAKREYSIGVGSTDFNTGRPIRIEQAILRDAGNVDYTVDVTMLQEEYTNIPVKDISARPGQMWYKPDFPLGVITFDYLPDTNYTLIINSWKPFAKITDPGDSTQLSFPDGYEAALMWNLARQLMAENKRPQDSLINEKAATTLSAISAAYGETPKVTFWDIPFAGRGNRDGRALFGK
jgi:hypothetical protein